MSDMGKYGMIFIVAKVHVNELSRSILIGRMTPAMTKPMVSGEFQAGM